MRTDETRLALILLALFLALLLPTVILTVQSYRQMQWETFHQHRLLAEELTTRINAELTSWIGPEESRSFAEYSFLTVSGANYITRSPLSQYPVTSVIPGARAYFQVDAQGRLTTPLLPTDGSPLDSFGVSNAEQTARQALEAEIRDLLSSAPAHVAADATAGAGSWDAAAPSPSSPASIAASAPAPAEPAPPQSRTQALFDRLDEADADRSLNTLGKVDDLRLNQPFEAKRETEAVRQSAQKTAARTRRFEEGRVAKEMPEFAEATSGKLDAVAVEVFESEVDPFQFARLDDRHFVLFRKVWRDGQRFIQGLVIEQAPFIEATLERPYRDTVLSSMSDLTVAYDTDVLAQYANRSIEGYSVSSSELTGDLLYRASLAPPLDRVELIFSIANLPLGTGATTVFWAAGVMLVVLIGGFLLMYRLGVGRIRLARQQQDFVSAVSHELKSPLTSIRMYGEILKAGWADEAKKRTYYDFIFEESERLTRLINNVLRLSRLSHNGSGLTLARVNVGELMAHVEGKVRSQIESNQFALDRDFEDAALATTVNVDQDAFAQIMINLVDNAMKFSARATKRVVELGVRLRGSSVEVRLRDFGAGIARDQLKKIFTLFYRAENELTRETVGTGIGLALVRQLATQMDAKVDVVNREPGAEFRVVLPVVRDA